MSLPSGTVTFLFTDIEGSTPRWEHDPDAMSTALAEHDALLRSTIEARGGVVFATGGDGFAAAFSDASSALGAALDVQDHVGLPVRMGLHTGTAVERDGDYFGRTVNRAGRIMSAGHGGQIVVSDVTAGLIRDDAADLVDLGEHRFNGIDAPIRLWQIGHGDFPPLRTATVVVGKLPDPIDRFIGRTEELSVLAGLIAGHRLVTVVGVGGMGKTRLVVEACDRARSGFDGGVWFVDLALAASDNAVVEEAASLFGVQAVAGRSLEERLIEYLEPRPTLVVFDNCEHVMRPTAGLIDRLLKACPGLKVVATSREALLLRGEHVMALGPLSMDDNNGGDCVDAVALFLERLTAEGAPAIVGDEERAVVLEICRQLDGMPLAIELAAGRARTLGASDVLARLGERLRLLSGGWRTGVGRQQTLSATLDWSYVLLDEREQVVFDRLAVFVGWFTVGDAVAVTGDSTLSDLQVLDVISALVDKSMCTVDLEAIPARYRYLETMRSYGRDHLSTSATLVEYRDIHAAHLAASANAIAKMLVGPDEVEGARHAERLMPDLRAALGWAVERHLDDVMDAIAALAVPVGNKGSYEVCGWFYDLRHDQPDRPGVKEAAMYYALYTKVDHAETRRLAHRLIEMTSDGSWLAWFCLAFVEFNEDHFDRTVEYQKRAYEIGEARPDDVFVHTLNPTVLAIFLRVAGHDSGALVKDGFARASTAQWPTGLAFAHYAAGIANPDPLASLARLNQALELAIDIGSGQVEAISRTLIDNLQVQLALLPPGELAVALIRQLRRLEGSGAMNTALLPLSEAVQLLTQVEKWRTAALICGWLDGRSGRDATSVQDHEAAIASIQRAIGDQWEAVCQEGRSMTSTQIFDTACEELQTIR